MVPLFVWAATIGAIFGSYALAAEILVDNEIFIPKSNADVTIFSNRGV